MAGAILGSPEAISCVGDQPGVDAINIRIFILRPFLRYFGSLHFLRYLHSYIVNNFLISNDIDGRRQCYKKS